VRAISSVQDLKAQNEQLVARLDAMLDLEGSELILEGRRTGLLLPERELLAPSCPTGATGKGMSGRRPVVKGWLRLCERFGCGHVFGLT
jgi:hypothetical protein